MIIAIDGLGVNGKTTLATRLSKELQLKYFNTGAVYRCIALEVIRNQLPIQNIEKLLIYFQNIKIDFIEDKVFLNNEDVTDKIQTEEISLKSTEWATIPEIKQFVRTIQKNFLNTYDTVIEGRDIATRVAPDANFKFYLYSDFETRVARLWRIKQDIPIEVIRKNLAKRDELDLYGGNFMYPENAIEIDTTNLDLEETFQTILKSLAIQKKK